ncbi:MAG: transposase IS116/IS110/IS902 family protein [Candidatus Peregrinibacteria bacterium GW2011_GWF2_33_10]|nr:MAG: transposase IS116/IS110/IS902 family protein [Candidatus Peregrinibacteria bacterium GW2011_GWF2_33_10]OGJ45355.1 MAG: hypothetical protein A2272_02840 [Candidatus Peregrinibacteria bacterium RIFOXYA12_FULL_33_12]OGJ50682.1 MAG: hypothetical protein A2307_03580 [Candidatus Peregrinibacteria bacterium RIFOXYB2_FULL_33_20]
MIEKTYVGIDVSKAKLDIAIRREGLRKIATFINSQEGIEECRKWLSDNNAKEAIIVVESTGSLHWLVCLLLTDYGYDVRLINPLITKKYQKSSIRDAKNDKIDAIRLAEIGRIEENLPQFFDSRETLKIKRYESLLAKLVHAKQQIKRAYEDAIEASTIIDVSLNLDCILECIELLDTAIDVLKKMITDTADDLAKEISQIKGVSIFQATVLSTAIKGRSFENRDQMIAFFGLDIRVRQSGTWEGKGCLSKRGNPFYRKILFQIGWSLWRHNEEYKAYYDSIHGRGKHYYTCILATARKFLRYFFRVYKFSLVNSL